MLTHSFIDVTKMKTPIDRKSQMPQQRIFLAHAKEDKIKIEELYDRLKASGFSPWLDTVDLVGGQTWQAEIVKAIKEAAICLVCLSKNSVSKRGFVQKEFRLAMSTYAELAPGSIYLIPLRLDDCEVPDHQIHEMGVDLRAFQWVDLFHPGGFNKLIQAINNVIPSITSSNNFQVGDVVAENIEFIANQTFAFSDCYFHYNSQPNALDKLHPLINECRESALQIAQAKSKKRGIPFFNGPTVRLNRIELNNENPITEAVSLSIFLSSCQWHDWVVQQHCLLDDEPTIKCNLSPEQIRQICVDEQTSSDKKRNMENVQTCNQLGTSIVIISSDGFVGIQKRSGGLDNEGRWGPTVSENISRYYDEEVKRQSSRFVERYGDEGPQIKRNLRSWLAEAGENFIPEASPNGFYCVIRGIFEEFGDFMDHISLEDIRLTAIAFDREHCVPHLYFLVEPKLTMDQMHKVRQSQMHLDSWETNEIYWFRWSDHDSVMKVLSGEWANVSKAAVMRAIQLKLREEGRSDLEVSEFFSVTP